MDPTYISILIFILTTVVYYIFKPKQTLEDIDPSNNSSIQFTKNSYIYLIIYLLVVILTQFFINSVIIINKCGGSVTNNIAVGALMTFIPWVLIFGSSVLILKVFPSFKSAFSNVIGYFSVSGRANNVLAKLLVNNEIEKQVNNEDISTEKKQDLRNAAETIMKLCGNVSIMINEIVPDNFTKYWELLTPLIKPKYNEPTGSEELLNLKNELLNIVILRDNIGEGFWYLYTALLLISIVQYKITSRPCVVDANTMKKNHDNFLKQEEIEINKQNKMKSQTYVG
jgi:hypothetical protein